MHIYFACHNYSTNTETSFLRCQRPLSIKEWNCFSCSNVTQQCLLWFFFFFWLANENITQFNAHHGPRHLPFNIQQEVVINELLTGSLRSCCPRNTTTGMVLEHKSIKLIGIFWNTLSLQITHICNKCSQLWTASQKFFWTLKGQVVTLKIVFLNDASITGQIKCSFICSVFSKQ